MNLGGTIRLNRTGLCVVIGIFVLIVFYISSGKKDEVNLTKSDQEISLKQLLYSAIEAAERGGKEIRNVRGPLDIKNKGKTKEGVNISATVADAKSHCVMYQTLKQTFSQLQIVSEEQDTLCDRLDLKLDLTDLSKFKDIPDVNVPIDQITVWIDPLDATKEYIEAKIQYVATMVCVAVKGKPVIGVIHKPFIDKTSWAWHEKIKSEDLKKPEEGAIDNPIVIISLSHAGDVIRTIKKAFSDSVNIVQAAGAGYKSLEVAAGNATVYFHTTSIQKWDICAGNAILNALGGKMTTGYNEEIDYSNTGKVVNDKGLIATVYNHDFYVEKLGGSQKMQ